MMIISADFDRDADGINTSHSFHLRAVASRTVFFLSFIGLAFRTMLNGMTDCIYSRQFFFIQTVSIVFFENDPRQNSKDAGKMLE